MKRHDTEFAHFESCMAKMEYEKKKELLERKKEKEDVKKKSKGNTPKDEITN